MKFDQYGALFEEILTDGYSIPPYDNPDYIAYTKLNESRQNRWLKKAELLSETIEEIKSIGTQKWILITEPWCGDASHSVPIVKLMADINLKIDLEVQLRDQEPFLINQYLTNGGKAVPILIARDENGKDLFVWGPRPAECQALMIKNKKAALSMDEQKQALQKWYNKDKGISMQKEIIDLLKAISQA
jgi:hypothetical protein